MATNAVQHGGRVDFDGLAVGREQSSLLAEDASAGKAPTISPIGGHRSRSASVTSGGKVSPVIGGIEKTSDAEVAGTSQQRGGSRFAWGNGGSWANRASRSTSNS